jgi:type VII secretion protein EccB
MPSRRDQIQAYTFVSRRMVASLLTGRPDQAEHPLRRTFFSVVGGIAASALLVAGVGIYGLLNPGGSTAFRTPGAIIVVKESGTRFIYRDGSLHAVLNIASARLLAGQRGASVVQVSEKSLSGVARGLPVGIPGAPDDLPDAASLSNAPWQVCQRTVTSSQSGQETPTTTLVIGSVRGASGALDQAHAILVSAPDGTEYLVWNGTRLRVDDTGVLAALGLSGARPVPVGDAWINAVPAGRDLKPPVINGLGNQGLPINTASTTVGEILELQNIGTAPQFFVVLSDGIASISPVGAALVDMENGGQSTALPPSALPGAQRSAARVDLAGLPETAPRETDPGQSGQSACVRYTPGSSVPATPSITLAEAAGIPTSPAATATSATGAVDRVQVQPGGGALVRAGAGAAGVVFLVTDTGVAYPLTGKEAQQDLGYGNVTPSVFPVSLLGVLPVGPALDPAAAAKLEQPVVARN